MPDEKIPTWRDFPDFYENTFIKNIANSEKWTVSDKDKRPIDMYALIHKNKVWGMAFDRGYNPLVDLKTLCETIPSATNNAYYLDALVDKYVILDIEPKCPDKIKQRLLELPYIYGEVSMSGKGIHLVFELPEKILDRYPDAKMKLALKEDHGYYEILLNHMVTFTRKMIQPSPCTENISTFENVFELLAMKAKPSTSTINSLEITEIDTDNIPHFNTLVSPLKFQNYNKSPDDFHNDMSKYEFGAAGFYYHALEKLLDNNKYKGHEYTDEEKAIILYSVIKEKIPFREKHEQVRNNMPWLLYIATRLIEKSDNSADKEQYTCKT